MNPRDFVFPVAAGAAAAILTMAALSATLGGIVLSSLAQLPIFLVGLSLGAQAAAVATASSFAVASIMVRVDFGFFFALAVGVPATILVRQALLWRPRGDDIAWYPPAGLLLVCLGLFTGKLHHLIHNTPVLFINIRKLFVCALRRLTPAGE